MHVSCSGTKWCWHFCLILMDWGNSKSKTFTFGSLKINIWHLKQRNQKNMITHTKKKWTENSAFGIELSNLLVLTCSVITTINKLLINLFHVQMHVELLTSHWGHCPLSCSWFLSWCPVLQATVCGWHQRLRTLHRQGSPATGRSPKAKECGWVSAPTLLPAPPRLRVPGATGCDTKQNSLGD